MAEQEQNRNESATPFKREEARKRGVVAKSVDVNSLSMLVAALLGFHFFGAAMARKEGLLFQGLLSNAHHYSLELDQIAALATRALAESLILLAPVLGILVVFAVLGNFLQTGPVFSSTPLKPDLARINPVTGFKRIFSLKLLVEAVKTGLKFLLLGWVLYASIRQLWPALLASQGTSPASIGSGLIPQATGLWFKLVVALAVVAVVDLMFSRWEYGRQLRMSRREIKEEVKRREGDPRIKARLRELQREAVKRARSIGRVKDADALIVNPVRLAVAVKYDEGKVDAPLVIAKGAGFLAWRMRKVAYQANVPVVQNRPLARALFHTVPIDRPVPATHYGALARVLLWAYSIRRQGGTRESTA